MQSRLMIQKGGSMMPTLRNSDILYMKECLADDISAGDVIIFTHPLTRDYIVHRVVYTGNGGIWTRGDNNLENDPYVITPEALQGRVEKASRAGKTINVRGGAAGIVTGKVCNVMARCKYAWKRSMTFIMRLKHRWVK